jgi:hypothetical protein
MFAAEFAAFLGLTPKQNSSAAHSEQTEFSSRKYLVVAPRRYV